MRREGGSDSTTWDATDKIQGTCVCIFNPKADRNARIDYKGKMRVKVGWGWGTKCASGNEVHLGLHENELNPPVVLIWDQ